MCCPIVFSFILLIFWLIRGVIAKYGFSTVFEKFLVTMAITFFYFQAPVINALSGILDCTNINNNDYITNYLIEQCSGNPRYDEWRNYFVIPMFCFFALVLPICPFYYMHKNKERLFTKNLISKIGFLLNGYSKKTFFW